MPTTIEDLVQFTDDMLQGQTHLFCALVDALEAAGVTTRADVQRAIQTKVDWLAAHKARLEVASPLLLADDWLTRPPRDPSDPFDDRPKAQVLRFPPRSRR